MSKFFPWQNTTLYAGKELTGYLYNGLSRVFDNPHAFGRDAKLCTSLGWEPFIPICKVKIKLKK
jgi:hypothetical protein